MVPTLSVLLPVYNQAAYVARTLASVLAQTCPDFELLVHDDGSTDNSARLIRHYAARDPRIQASFGPNAGKCAVTNQLAAQARGRWCVLLDADDVMLPQRLAVQLAYHQTHPEVDASSCHCHYIDGQGRQLGTQRYPGLRTPDEGRQALARGQFVHCAFTGLMVKKSVFLATGGLRSEFWPSEDFEFVNRLLAEGFALVIIPQVLMEYRIHATGVTSRRPLHMFDMLHFSTRCLALRRAGQPELSFADFMAEQRRRPWWVRANSWRYSYALILHRQATYRLHTRDYFRGGGLLAASLLLSPNFVLATIRKKLRRDFFPRFSPAA